MCELQVKNKVIDKLGYHKGPGIVKAVPLKMTSVYCFVDVFWEDTKQAELNLVGWLQKID